MISQFYDQFEDEEAVAEEDRDDEAEYWDDEEDEDWDKEEDDGIKKDVGIEEIKENNGNNEKSVATNDDDDVGSKPDKNGLQALLREWKNYQNRYHPEIARIKKTMPSFGITCEEYAGSYEPFGSVSACHIVWGHRIVEKSFITERSTADDTDMISSKFYFPKNSKSIFLDFMARFYLKVCLKEKDFKEERVALFAQKLSKIMKRKIYADVREY